MTEAELSEKFAAYAAGRLPEYRNLKVTHIQRIHGGASRQTYALDVRYESETGTVCRGLILRRDPPESLIDTEREIEFAALASVHGKNGLPVPDALILETDLSVLGAPFFVMERIESGAPLNPFKLSDVDALRPHIGQQFFQHLGAIAAIPVAGTPLESAIEVPGLDACWRRELDYWTEQIRTNARQPEPVAEAAIRHLYRHPPPPAQRVSIVHGDYRSGNFLCDENGHITALLDWEMAHIGDPYEDLAWATDPLWCGQDTVRAAGFLPWPEAIEVWQNASGCQFDPAAFEWWSLFAHVKAFGIWVTSAKTFADGANDDPILAWSGWFTHAAHELIMAMRLAPKYGARA